LFKTKQCAGCHPEPLFSDFSYRNIGLKPDSMLKDYGRMKIAGNSEDSLKFMVPSLRNLRVTFPYGHDGRFYSAQDAITHYSEKVENGPTTDPMVVNKIPLTKTEISLIKSFLFSLTDSVFLKDPRFIIKGYRPKDVGH
jgi:cytochrome c peroxidase